MFKPDSPLSFCKPTSVYAGSTAHSLPCCIQRTLDSHPLPTLDSFSPWRFLRWLRWPQKSPKIRSNHAENTPQGLIWNKEPLFGIHSTLFCNFQKIAIFPQLSVIPAPYLLPQTCNNQGLGCLCSCVIACLCASSKSTKCIPSVYLGNIRETANTHLPQL